MLSILIIIHVIVCFALIMVVLLQTGKGADMGAAFGGGASQTLFGTSGASTFLSKATTVAAIIFMLTSLSLAYMSNTRSEKSLVLDNKIPVESKTTTTDKTAGENIDDENMNKVTNSQQKPEKPDTSTPVVDQAEPPHDKADGNE